MHSRNRFQGNYDFKELTKALPELVSFVVMKFGRETIDFADPPAVKALNRAILMSDYGIEYWNIPDTFLCPPIPGRADYIHTVADLFNGKKDPSIRVLDIGVGANCIYPLIGNAEYKWKFVGSDIDQDSIKNAQDIISKNSLIHDIEVRLQNDKTRFFKGIIKENEKFDLTICNPPFHASAEDARAGTERKWKNLGEKLKSLNFGGKSNELWCAGGEKAFVTSMIRESKSFAGQCHWFTTLVSKDENLRDFEKELKLIGAVETKILKMEQGQKKSRVLAWTFQKP